MEEGKEEGQEGGHTALETAPPLGRASLHSHTHYGTLYIWCLLVIDGLGGVLSVWPRVCVIWPESCWQK